jgi:Reverse transcriptase (RNA-dependent DNA polymerase)
VDFDNTYSPTVTWPSIRLVLLLVLIHSWKTRQLDFVQAFPQVDISHQQFVELPKGIKIEGVSSKDWVLEALQNVYGGKDAGQQWYLHLKKHLEDIGFKVSQHNECMFYRGRVIYCLYTDDSILAAPTDEELEEVIRDMKSTGLDLTVEGMLEDFLGVHIDTKEDGSYELSQSRLIKSVILEVFGGSPPSTAKDVPMALSRLLSRHLESEDHDES